MPHNQSIMERVLSAQMVLFAPVLLVLASPASAEPIPWRGVDASTGQLVSVDDLTQLAQDFPDSASVRLRLLNATAETGDTDNAGRQALQLATRGYAFSPAAEEQLTGYMDLDVAGLYRAATALNRQHVEKSSLVTTIPVEAQLVESIARDPVSGDLYATTVVSRALFVKRGEASWAKIEIEGAGSLSGIAYDKKAKLFWIASSNFDQTPGEESQSAVIGYAPATGEVVRRLYANGAATLGDVAVGEDGTVFAADPAAGVIYYAGPADDGLRALVGQGVFRSPQGMVAVPGTNLLIVSDYRYGLAALDRGSANVSRVVSRGGVFLDGIDALQLHGRSLIGVQNGHSPMRIVQLDMSKDWLTVENSTVLESAHSAWTEPVGATVDGDRLLYVATGQWDRFGEGGALAEGAEAWPTRIRALPLGK